MPIEALKYLFNIFSILLTTIYKAYVDQVSPNANSSTLQCFLNERHCLES